MTVIAIVADCHIGNHRVFGGEVVSGLNERCRLAISAFRRAVHAAENAGAEEFSVLGDLFDTHNPSPQMVNMVMEICASAEDMIFNLVLGNHEAHSSEELDHALAPFTNMPNVRVIDEPYWANIGGLYFPYASSQGGIARFKEELDALLSRRALEKSERGNTSRAENNSRRTRSSSAEGAHFIAMHCGIADFDTPEYLQSSGCLSAKDLRELAFKEDLVIFSGDWHSPREWVEAEEPDPSVVQCGALIPTGFDNPGFDYGRMYLYDTASRVVRFQRIPGPRFLSYTMEEARAAEQRSPGWKKVREESTVYVQIKATTEEVAEAKELLDTWKRQQVCRYARILPEDKEVRARAEKAAAAARSGSTLEEALEEYVKKIAISEDVNRKSVLDRARKYLGV